MPKHIRLAVADDHKLLRKGLVQLLSDGGYTVVVEADNGRQLIDKLATAEVDVILMDVSMPELDGIETTRSLRKSHPGCKVIALSMDDEEITIIKMIRAGAKGYLLKNCDPDEMQRAIHDVYEKGFYYSDIITGPLLHTLQNPTEGSDGPKEIKFTNRELMFLRLACSEMSYKEIAEVMNLSVRTVDGYRDALFDKLKIKSRVGLVIYAVKHNIYKP